MGDTGGRLEGRWKREANLFLLLLSEVFGSGGQQPWVRVGLCSGSRISAALEAGAPAALQLSIPGAWLWP